MSDIGHNNPPLYDPDLLAALQGKANTFAGAGIDWQATGVSDETGSRRLTDFIAGLRKQIKATEDARKEAKQPHIDAGKAVDEAFKPIATVLEQTLENCKALQTSWLEAKEKEQREAVEAAISAAEAEQRRLLDEAVIAEHQGDHIGARAARLAAAQIANDLPTAAPARAVSHTGAGRTMSLRTTYAVDVVSLPLALKHYQAHPEVMALIKRLASADARGTKGQATIPGIRIYTERNAA